MRVVLDTNIIVATVLSPRGFASGIMRLVEVGVIDLVVSEDILVEYTETRTEPELRARHKRSEQEITELVAGIREVSQLVTPGPSLHVVRDDPDDNKFVEAAVAGHAPYIVSRDPHLLGVGSYKGIQILPPHLFVPLVEEGAA